jgi:hypothetical protein
MPNPDNSDETNLVDQKYKNIYIENNNNNIYITSINMSKIL